MARSPARFLPLIFLALSLPACAPPSPSPSEGKDSFQIQPLRPIALLRQEALAATPPAQPDNLKEPDLVELSALDPTIQLDIRYASDRNFLGTPFYTLPRAYLQRPAAEALLRAHNKLREEGMGLLIFDAYRPWFVTKMFWDATPPEFREFVADPAQGSRHNRACAVDLTLYDLESGRPLPMPGDFDEFRERAHIDYPGGSEEERQNRSILRKVMEESGYQVFPAEWWHYDFAGWEEYPILNRSFEDLE